MPLSSASLQASQTSFGVGISGSPMPRLMTPVMVFARSNMARMAPCFRVLALSLIPSMMLMLSFLSLHAAGAVAAHELGDVGDGDAVEIAGDAVLQAARRDCELERRLLVLIVVQPVDQAARKAVAAAH